MHIPRCGILLVAYGVATPVAGSVLRSFEARVAERFPHLPISWGFSSRVQGNRPTQADRPGRSPVEALRDFAAQGVEYVAVQAMHCIPGAEHDALCASIADAEQHTIPQQISIGSPLLTEPGSVPRLAAAIGGVSSLAAATDADAILWVGHGSSHAGHSCYNAVAQALTRQYPQVFLGTLKPVESYQNCCNLLRQHGYTRITLAPLFSLVGRHVSRDLVGNGPLSWKSRLEAEGFECHPHLKGMLEYPAFADLWIERLHEALARIRIYP